MKLSLNWLRRYVDVDWDVDEIAHRLTLSGTEVDGVIAQGVAFEGVQVGKVLAVAPHPNADRLQLATVDTGTETLEVVCGASNCRTGLTVAYAGIGARLPDGTKIRKAKIRDVVSLGMLCGEDELGLSDTRAGIMELPESLKAGVSLSDALNLQDHILDVGITANRGDCLSHLGVARELAALAGVPVKWPETTLPSVVGGDAIPVEILAPDRCARYVARVMSGLVVGPSPFWMRRLLTTVGVRPINNLVDVTNFVLFEYGQPLHAFDLRHVRGERIVVRTATEGETMKTLDEIERTFTPEDLLICDGERPVAVAGVMGGLDSEVKSDTSTVLLESAWFEPTTVRLTSRRLGLRSESSHRFERAVDPERTLDAANRALHLFAQLSNGGQPVAVEPWTDARPRSVERPTISYYPQSATKLLGVEIPADKQQHALTALGFQVEAHQDDAWQVKVPSFRGDVAESADLIEEVARFVGYDTIPTPTPRVTASSLAGHARERRIRAGRQFLQNRGFHQALNYSFLGESLRAHFSDHPSLGVINPLSRDQAVLRTELAASLVDNVAYNLRHGSKSIRLFEIGRVFHAQSLGVQPVETERLGIVWTGELGGHWSVQRRTADFFDLKGVVDDLGRSVGHEFEWSVAEVKWLTPGATARVSIDGVKVGIVGRLHPKIGQSLGIHSPVFIAELDIVPLFGEAVILPQYQAYGRFPSATRDMSLRLSRKITAGQVLSSIEEMGLEHIDSVEVFDVYEGDSLGPDHYSLGLSVTYRAADKTLTDDVVKGLHEKLVAVLASQYGADRR